MNFFTHSSTVRMAVLFTLLLAITACKRDNEPEPTPLPEPITSGMIIGCEGTFNQNNASLHFIGDDGSTQNNLYQAANGVSPGDVLQSFRVFGQKGYAVLNNSQKVEVVNAETFSALGTITGCDYPRDVLVISGKGYLTNGSLAGEVFTFNPNSYNITGSIAVGNGPEQIRYNGSYLFVANSGGWISDNTVSVIDPISDLVVATVAVGDRPVALEVDYQNNVWVLCSGAIEYDADWNIVNETEAKVVRIDGQQWVVTAELSVGTIGDHPTFMASNTNQTLIYIVNNGLLTVDVSNGTINAGPIESGNFGSIGVHPETGELYLSSTPDFVSNDEVFVYGSQGDLRRTETVGVAARSFTFKP